MIRILLSDTLLSVLAPGGVDNLCDPLSTSLNAKRTFGGLTALLSANRLAVAV